MVTRMDREIGRLMARVAELGLDENTIFVFTSDNGPLYDKLGGTDCEFFNSHAGLRGRKGSLYEGGVRVPCIVRWPGKIAAGQVSDRVTGFEDWLPTLLELVGDENVPHGLDGVSFAPTLLGKKQDERAFLYREFPAYGGQQSIHKGKWKALRQKLAALPANGTPVTELYDLNADPAESKDVAKENPTVVAELEKLLREQHTPSKDFPFKVLDR